jgi:putative transposase
MDLQKKEKIALFRFQLIAPFLALTKDNWGEKERILQKIVEKEWEIPGSGRSYIGRSTVLDWLNQYEESERQLTSLYPKERGDKGRFRSLDRETENLLVALKREFKEATVPTILKIAQERKLLPLNFKASIASIYRVLNAYGLNEIATEPVDRRRFETELPNDIWQSDCMHGPLVTVEGKKRKTFLFALLDDHSRLIPHAQFYLKENLESFLDCLKCGFLKRGLPRKVYVDNGPYFRSHQLAHILASLGVALIHCKPYTPEAKGKCERWFKTVRSNFLATIPEEITLEELNKRFNEWISKYYHLKVHTTTKEQPLERYTKHIHLIRKAPADLEAYFRAKAVRRVYKDRTVCLLGCVYEAPINLIEKQVTLLYHAHDLKRVEILYSGQSFGFLVPLDATINSKVKRLRDRLEVETRLTHESPESPEQETNIYKAGELFGKEEGGTDGQL